MVIGLVIGVVIGATVIAPSLPVVAGKNGAENSKKPEKKEATWQKPVVRSKAEIQRTWSYTGEYASTVPLLGELAKRLETNVEAASGGDIILPYRDPGSLVPREDIANALASGILDAAFVSASVFAENSPALNLIAGTPFGPPPRELLAWLSQEETKELVTAQFSKNGVHAIPCGVLPPQGGGWFTKKISGSDDLAGLRIALTGLASDVAERVGMEPSSHQGGQIFVHLERGKLDGAFLHTPAIDAHLGIQKLAPFAYFPGWHRSSGLMVLAINLEKWKATAQKAKAILKATCGDNIKFGYAASEAAQFSALKKFQRDGITIRRWPTKILTSLEQAWNDVAAELAEKNKDFAALQKSQAKFRKQYAVWNELSR